jgi:hypothetical protein
MAAILFEEMGDVNYATFQLRQPVGVVGKSTQMPFMQASYDLPFSNYATRAGTPGGYPNLGNTLVI